MVYGFPFVVGLSGVWVASCSRTGWCIGCLSGSKTGWCIGFLSGGRIGWCMGIYLVVGRGGAWSVYLVVGLGGAWDIYITYKKQVPGIWAGWCMDCLSGGRPG